MRLSLLCWSLAGDGRDDVAKHGYTPHLNLSRREVVAVKYDEERLRDWDWLNHGDAGQMNEMSSFRSKNRAV